MRVQPQAAAARILLLARAADAHRKIRQGQADTPPVCAVLERWQKCTFPNHRPSLTPLRVDCKALWRCGIYAAEALASGGKLQDATSSEVIQHPRWVMGMFDGRGL